MASKNFYVLVYFTDEVMGICQSEITDDRDRAITQKSYIRYLGFKFPIWIFRYRRGGSKSCWVLSSNPPGEVNLKYLFN